MTALRCPVCRAENTEGPNCRRCKADLELLFSAEHHRESLLHQARSCLARGARGDALALARRAHALRRGEDSWQLLAVLHLLGRDFARALETYRMAKIAE